MKLAAEIFAQEGKETFTIANLNDRLNARFQEIKQRNPRGFLDQFESQLELIALDIAVDVGAEFEAVQTREKLYLLYDISRTGGALLRQRKAELVA